MKAFLRLSLILILVMASGSYFFGQIRSVWMYGFDTWKNEPDFGNRLSYITGWWHNEKSTCEPRGYLPSDPKELTEYLDDIVPMVYIGGGESVIDIFSRVDDEIREVNAPTIIGVSHEALENFPGGVQAAIGGLETGMFIQLEHQYEQFREFRSDYGKVAQTIANTFDPTEFNVASIANTSGLGVNYFEPEIYTYNFVAPLRSKLLCKNSHLMTTLVPPADVNAQIPSKTYEGASGALESAGTVASTERVWFLGNSDGVVLEDSFTATENSFFSAELLEEEPFCGNTSLYLPNSFTYRFFTSIYGPRMLTSGGNITSGYDFHRGEDIVDSLVLPANTPAQNMPDVICMCDGDVVEVTDGGDEGKSVIVKCDAEFNGNATALGNIYIAYRHLKTYAVPTTGLPQPIGKGDLIGKMGGSGVATDNPHLHLSVLKKNASDKYINLHPMRVFNPDFNKHLNLPVDEPPSGSEPEKKRVNLLLLDHSNSSATGDSNYAIFRIALPYNKVALRAIIIRNGTTYTQTADLENISETRDLGMTNLTCCNSNPLCNTNCLDNPTVGNLKLFPLPFVRAGGPSFTAYGRYNNIKDTLDNKVPDHPANFFPLVNQGIFATPAYVLDIKAKGLPQFFNPLDFEIDVLDIWGNGVRGTMTAPPVPLIVPTVTGEQAVTQAPIDTLGKIASPSQPTAAEDFNVSIYPNPNSGNELFLELHGSQSETAEIEIFNLAGMLMLATGAEIDSEGRFKIPVGTLAPGAYLVRVKTSELNATGRFVKQ